MRRWFGQALLLTMGLVGLVSPIFLTACSPKAPALVAYNTAIPLNEVMAHVIEPAAFQFWDGSGTIFDEHGVRDRSPTTEAGWKVVENGAATVVEASNGLLLPGRTRAPESEWTRYAQELGKVALKAKAAAEAKDKDAVFNVGMELDDACEACHKKFLPGA